MEFNNLNLCLAPFEFAIIKAKILSAQLGLLEGITGVSRSWFFGPLSSLYWVTTELISSHMNKQLVSEELGRIWL